MNIPRLPESTRIPDKVMLMWADAPKDVALSADMDAAGRTFYELGKPGSPNRLHIVRPLNNVLYFYYIDDDSSQNVNESEVYTFLNRL